MFPKSTKQLVQLAKASPSLHLKEKDHRSSSLWTVPAMRLLLSKEQLTSGFLPFQKFAMILLNDVNAPSLLSMPLAGWIAAPSSRMNSWDEGLYIKERSHVQ